MVHETANHESPRTLAPSQRQPALPDPVPGIRDGAACGQSGRGRATSLYDRASDAISLDEMELILIERRNYPIGQSRDIQEDERFTLRKL